ncbi:hypothetical protein ACLOJK_035690 [Asimina triloba]
MWGLRGRSAAGHAAKGGRRMGIAQGAVGAITMTPAAGIALKGGRGMGIALGAGGAITTTPAAGIALKGGLGMGLAPGADTTTAVASSPKRTPLAGLCEFGASRLVCEKPMGAMPTAEPIGEIQKWSFDEKQKKVIILGPFNPECLIKNLYCKVGCKTIICYEILEPPPPPLCVVPDRCCEGRRAALGMGLAPGADTTTVVTNSQKRSSSCRHYMNLVLPILKITWMDTTVNCNGAALYYRNRFWLLGTTPTEAQISDIVGWLLEYHNSTTGLSTDSLLEAGYPGAAELGDDVCGMAAVRITSKDFLFWFRSHTAKEIRWGGAKHDPVDKDDDGRKMHPRSSFKAFLEVVKRRSLPWEDVEMDAIHSLQLILRGSLQGEMENDMKSIVKATPSDMSIQGIDELRVVTNEMVRLIETATVPIFAIDASGNINGWNAKAAELTGLMVEPATGSPLIDLVEDDSVEVLKNMIELALQEIQRWSFDEKQKKVIILGPFNPECLIKNLYSKVGCKTIICYEILEPPPPPLCVVPVPVYVGPPGPMS